MTAILFSFFNMKGDIQMNYQLENFIDFCDNMQIVEEGFKNTKIYAVIKNILEGLKKAILIIMKKIDSLRGAVRVSSDIANKYTELFNNLEREASSNIPSTTKVSDFRNRIDELKDEIKNFNPDEVGINSVPFKTSELTSDLKRSQSNVDRMLKDIETYGSSTERDYSDHVENVEIKLIIIN